MHASSTCVFTQTIKAWGMLQPDYKIYYSHNCMEQFQTITACAFLIKDGKLLLAKRAATKTFLPNKYGLIGDYAGFGTSGSVSG